VYRHARGDGAECSCALRLFEGWSAFRRLFKPPRHDQRYLMAAQKARATTQPCRQTHEFFKVYQRVMLNPPWGAAFVVNSEPHTGARRSVRLCVWLKINALQIRANCPATSNQENRRFSRFPPTWPLVPLPHAPCPLFLVSGVVGGIAPSSYLAR
jgi:hypothetical protein